MILKVTFLCLIFFLAITPKGVGEDIAFKKDERKISIPKISLESGICTLSRESCLNGGVWMKYMDERGNLLLTGHSFSILPLRAGAFFNLDDITVGDRVYIELPETLVYEVIEVFVTSRYDLEIENFDNLKNILVLYSCYPIWSASERIVVRARLCDFCENEI